MRKYQEMKKMHQDEINNFEGIFFAFTDRQFAEGMAKVGLEAKETSKIMSIGMGGYLLKTRAEALDNMLARHKNERKELKKEEKLLLDAIVHELKNHEYCVTGDARDALQALNLTAAQVDKKLLSKAIKLA